MDSPRESVLNHVKRVILKTLSKNAAAKVYLFGSWARSEEKRTSDIDVAFEFNKSDEDVIGRTLASIRDALEESNIPYKVDVVNEIILNTPTTYRGGGFLDCLFYRREDSQAIPAVPAE